MANVKVRDLTNIAGADLFSDSESFMQDLSDYELALQGGVTPASPALSPYLIAGGIAVFGIATIGIVTLVKRQPARN
jgi:hypothetical protein